MDQQDRRGTERAVSTKPIDVAPGDTATISRRAMLALTINDWSWRQFR